MSTPTELRYTESHEWARLNDDGTVTVGITDYAQEQLGDVVFAETPEVDRECEAQEAVAVIESVKAASDIYTPLAGKIIDTNADLTDSPELINSGPYEDGWLFQLLPDDGTAFEDLMDSDAYEAFIASS